MIEHQLDFAKVRQSKRTVKYWAGYVNVATCTPAISHYRVQLNSLTLLWTCSERALDVPWHALIVFWQCSERALDMLWTCSGSALEDH